MKKFTDFIVDKRYFILCVFLILTVISAIVSRNVNINYDISKYLPSTSETRIGMDIMEKEFEDKQSSFNLMFKGLTEEKKEKIRNELEKVDGVSSVDYEKNEDYNKDDYTLYVVNVDDVEDSKLATQVFEEITEKYKDYDINTSGAIAQRNTPVLPTWIVVLAVGCALVILIVMSESYVEAFLFLFTILMAVLLNSGTNIIFSSVSNITSSISAILQMALSMDYSIMLINRYRQEREKEDNKIVAMKKALYNAFKSISSSSVTTIVGLMALVFMSFKIGRDLGFVLAKGVLFSLICIFFVLPALILMFDKLIEKTKKKSPNIKLDKVGKISFKLRYIAVPVFIIVFIVSFLQRGNLGILYTDSESDNISEVFKENNQIAVIYKNEDEEKVSKYLKDIEEKDKVKEVLAYGNTINQELKFDELNDKLKDLGSDVEIEDYLLQIVYYHYYNPDENNKMTFNDFTKFIKDKVYTDKDLSDKLDDEEKRNIDRLENFTNEELINKKRNSSEISKILEIDKSKVDDILVFYNSKNNNIKISLDDFIKFMNKDVLTNEKYSKKMDKSTKNSLNELSKFTNISTIQKKMTSKEMADLFGIDRKLMESLYTYYISVNKVETKMSLAEFSKFVIEDVLNDSQYKKMFDKDTVNSIKMLNTFSNKNIIEKNKNAKELAELLGIDEESVKQLLFFKYKNTESDTTLGIAEFINNVNYISNNTNYLKDVDLSSIEKLSVFAQNNNNINTTKMNKKTLSSIFDKVSPGLVGNIYLFLGMPDNYTMSPQEFVNLIINNFSKVQNDSSIDEPALKVDPEKLNNLKLLKLVIDDSISSDKEYTATELSAMLNIDKEQMYNLYALIDLVKDNTKNWKSTPNEFVKLILANSENDSIKSSINKETIEKLKLLSNIMESAIKNKTYTYEELSKFIGVDKTSSKNIYALYKAKNVTLKLKPKEFVDFVLKHKNDDALSKNLDLNTIKSLKLVQSVMNGTINSEKYNAKELSKLLGIDEGSLNLLYGLYNSKYINSNQTISLKEFIDFLINDVMKDAEYSKEFDEDSTTKINVISNIMDASINKTKYTKDELLAILNKLTDYLDDKMISLLYIYYGSSNNYDDEWTMTIEKFINYLNDEILTDNRFKDFIEDDMREDIIEAKDTINDSKEMLIGNDYSRIVINTKFDLEGEETFEFVQEIKDKMNKDIEKVYVIGNSPMAYEMSQTFNDELNFITVLTMLLIFIVVAITFKSIIAPVILVLTIQCAVFMTMGILALSGSGVYFIAILIVQSILMGATIDYAILYTSYYIESRKSMNIKEAVINSYNKSIHTILTSASILIIATLIVGHFASAITAKICKTISEGTICSTILILVLLPAVIAACDRLIMRKQKKIN